MSQSISLLITKGGKTPYKGKPSSCHLNSMVKGNITTSAGTKLTLHPI